MPIGIRAQAVELGWVGLWRRVDGRDAGPGGMLAFDNMHDRPVTGTTDWARHEIVLDVSEEAEAVFFGMLLNGKGTAWVDDLKLEAAEGP